MSVLSEEYRALWHHYGIELPDLTAPGRAAVPPSYLIRSEGPKEPVVGFVTGCPKENLRFRKEEEALWERILQALSLSRRDVLLAHVSMLVPEAPLTWDHFGDTLAPSLRGIVFFGEAGVPHEARGQGAGRLPQGGHFLVTHDLGRLLRDPQAKKEAWGTLKDLMNRLK